VLRPSARWIATTTTRVLALGWF